MISFQHLKTRQRAEFSSPTCATKICLVPALLFSLLLGAQQVAAHTISDLQTTVKANLARSGWGTRAIDSLLNSHANEFAIDAQSGWLDQRLNQYARLGRYDRVLRIVERHSQYTDLFVNALEPDRLARVILALSADNRDIERLLNLFVGWSTRSEIGYLLNVLEMHGSTIMHFSLSSDLFSVTESLVLAYAEGAPSEWLAWSSSEMVRQAQQNRLEEFLVFLQLHGRTVTLSMTSNPAYSRHFPELWRSYQNLLSIKTRADDRNYLMASLLSHEKLWETLAMPYGADALRNWSDASHMLLFTLWGSLGWSQPIEASEPLLANKPALASQRQLWILDKLASRSTENQSLGGWGVRLADHPEFWRIALNADRSMYLGCVLDDAVRSSRWDGQGDLPMQFFARVRSMSQYEPSALNRICREAPSIFVRVLPGYQLVDFIGDIWAGVPFSWLGFLGGGSELYLPLRYTGLLGRAGGARLTNADALVIGPRMTSDYLMAQKTLSIGGEATAFVPRPVRGVLRDFVLRPDGYLTPIPSIFRNQAGINISRELGQESLVNLAAEGLASSDFVQRSILHFRCAGQNLTNIEDTRCGT